MALVVAGSLGVLLAAAPGAHPLLLSHAESPPPAHTGGFGEPTCQACHTEYPLNMDGDLQVDGFPERYQPGAAYEVTLHLRSGGMERAGFQASVRVQEGPATGAAAGEIVILDDRVVVQEGGPVPYVQHAPGAAWTDGAATVAWTFRWTAPETEAKTVVVHVAANSANGDDSPFGDIVYTAERIGRPATEAESRPGSGG